MVLRDETLLEIYAAATTAYQSFIVNLRSPLATPALMARKARAYDESVRLIWGELMARAGFPTRTGPLSLEDVVLKHSVAGSDALYLPRDVIVTLQDALERMLHERGIMAHAALIGVGNVDPKKLRRAALVAALKTTARDKVGINKFVVKNNERRILALVSRIVQERLYAKYKGTDDICKDQVSFGYVSQLVRDEHLDILYVAIDNETGNVTAFIAVSVPTRNRWHIELICAHQGGGKIMQRIIDDARREPYVRRITLESVAPAVTFYRKFGFRNIKPSDARDDRDCHGEPVGVQLASQWTRNKTPKTAQDVWDDPQLRALFRQFFRDGVHTCDVDRRPACLDTDLWDMELCLKASGSVVQKRKERSE